jgi:hypothetical protein
VTITRIVRMRIACLLTFLGSGRYFSCSSHSSLAFSESPQPGPGPLPPLGTLSAGSRPAAAAQLQPGPGVLRPGPLFSEAGAQRFPSRSDPGPARSRRESFPHPGRGPLAPRDSSLSLASSSKVHPDLLKRFPSRYLTYRVPARCRYAASFHPGRGPQPLSGSGPTSASSGRAQPSQRPSTSPAESARVLVRPQPALSPRGLRHWHRKGTDNLKFTCAGKCIIRIGENWR